jgi:prepilin-type processing-associated H-X9-DG protein
VLFVQGGEENQLHPMSNVTDGTSNVVFITEQAGRNDHYIRRIRQSSNSGLTSAGWWGPWASYQHYQYQGYTADGTALGSACAVNCNNGQGLLSFHPGGINASRVDGSVAFISQTISVALMTELLTRDGGEVTNE